MDGWFTRFENDIKYSFNIELKWMRARRTLMMPAQKLNSIKKVIKIIITYN